MLSQPALPIERRRFQRREIEFDVVRRDLQDSGPGHDLPRVLSHAPPLSNRLKPALHSRMDAAGKHGEAELEVIDARRPILAHLQNQAVDPSHEGFLAVAKLLIEDVAHDVHQLLPTIISGIDTTAHPRPARDSLPSSNRTSEQTSTTSTAPPRSPHRGRRSPWTRRTGRIPRTGTPASASAPPGDSRSRESLAGRAPFRPPRSR